MSDERRHETTVDGVKAWATPWARLDDQESMSPLVAEVYTGGGRGYGTAWANPTYGEWGVYCFAATNQRRCPKCASAIALRLAPEAARLAQGESVESVQREGE